MFYVVNFKPDNWVEVLDTKDNSIERLPWSNISDLSSLGLSVRGLGATGEVDISLPRFKRIYCEDSFGLVVMEIISGNTTKRYSGVLFYENEDQVVNLVSKGIVSIRGIDSRYFDKSCLADMSDTFMSKTSIDVDIDNSSLSSFYYDEVPVYWNRWLRVVDPDSKIVTNLDLSGEPRNVALSDKFGRVTLWELIRTAQTSGYLDAVSTF